MTRRVAVVTAAAAAAAGAVIAAAGPAAAAGPSYIYTQSGRPAALATCYSACGATGRPIYPANGTSATMYCFWDSSTSTDGNYSSNQWYEVYINGEPGLWWIHSSYVYYQTTVPYCG
jgi:hypothetical protein